MAVNSQAKVETFPASRRSAYPWELAGVFFYSLLGLTLAADIVVAFAPFIASPAPTVAMPPRPGGAIGDLSNDDYVAQVLANEARDNSAKYTSEGLGAYMPKK